MNAKSLTDQIAAKVKIWRRIQSGEESYGEGTLHQQATEYQFDEVLPLVIENARSKWKPPRWAPKPKVMISMGGFSPETTMIAFSVLKPEYLFVLTSETATAGISAGNRVIPPRRTISTNG